MHITRLSLTLSLLGCGSSDSATPSENENDPNVIAACQLLEDFGDCGTCYTGVVTCTYGDISVTEDSCQGCQALVQVYSQLCNDGSADSAEQIENGVECTEADQD